MPDPDAEKRPGAHMAAESADALAVLARALRSRPTLPASLADLDRIDAIHTVARGSSDAAATILAYEFMQVLRRPVTSLPPSTFSLYPGVAMPRSMGLILSQSGASQDLVACATGMRANGARVLALVNRPSSAVEAAAEATIPVNAGPELAVPATKSVVGTVGAGLALLASWVPDILPRIEAAASHFDRASPGASDLGDIEAQLHAAASVYIVGRGSGFGAAQEVALKLKETAAVHAEAYSASEVLHGPLQLATGSLFILMIDTGEPATQPSLDRAEARLAQAGGQVARLRVPGAEILTPASAAAFALCQLYPVILRLALAKGLDPDRPTTLSKVTQTL